MSLAGSRCLGGVGEVVGVGGLVAEAPVVSLGLVGGGAVPSLVVVVPGGLVLAEDVAAEATEAATAERADGATAEEALEGQDSGDQKGDLADEQGLDDKEGQTSEEDRYQSEDLETGCGEDGEEELLDLGATCK